MSDKPWKAFERRIAEHFGTRRAIHGLSREAGEGEVKTDVFVNVHKWHRHMDMMPHLNELENPTALIVECKHSRLASHPSRRLLTRINDAKRANKDKFVVLLAPDGWMWVRIEDFSRFYDMLLDGPCEVKDLGTLPFTMPVCCEPFLIIKDTRKTAKFWKDAILEAEKALIPDEEKDFKFKRRMHVVCTGSNIRVSPIVGIPPNAMHSIASP